MGNGAWNRLADLFARLVPSVTERAAGELCKKLLTLSRDMAFLGGFKKRDFVYAKKRLPAAIYGLLGTIRGRFHIKVSE